MNISGEPLLPPWALLSALVPPYRHPADALPQRDYAERDWRDRVSLFRLGRDALAAGVATLPAGPVLAPAFICREALDGLAASGRQVALYRLAPELEPDWAHLGTLADNAAGVRPAALLLVHYFGIPADVRRAAAWCRERGVALIEDCAHSFLSRVAGRPVGTFGDMAVFSFRKQLPVDSGAALLMNAPRKAAPGRRGGIGMWAALRESAAWCVFASGSARLRRSLAAALLDEHPAPAAAPGNARSMDLATRRVIARLAPRFSHIAARRRENYAALAGRLQNPGAAVMVPSLPDGAAPWGLPLKMRNASDATALEAVLLSEGIGAWRWPDLPPEVTSETFPFEHGLAQQTVLLPVHQGLSQRHMEFIADTVTAWGLVGGILVGGIEEAAAEDAAHPR